VGGRFVTPIQHNGQMTEPAQPSSHQTPKRPSAAVASLTLLVRVPGRADLIRAYTAAEKGAADAYAAATGGIIDQLPT
jgi:hypothetical protein